MSAKKAFAIPLSIPLSLWYPVIVFLLVTLIILVSVLIYIYYNKADNVVVVRTQNSSMINPMIEQQTSMHTAMPAMPAMQTTTATRSKDELPVYPKELPQYNSESYQQVGILTSSETNKEPIILPLFSRKLHNHSDRYNYYTATDKNNMMRLPIRMNNNDCEDTIGCKEIYDKESVVVEIYKDRVFTATIYKKESPQYFADRY